MRIQHSPYLENIRHLCDVFDDGDLSGNMMYLTSPDFDNTMTPLARHKDDPYLFRQLVLTETRAIIMLFDFRENLQMTNAHAPQTPITPINNLMTDFLARTYNFSSDGKNPPYFDYL